MESTLENPQWTWPKFERHQYTSTHLSAQNGALHEMRRVKVNRPGGGSRSGECRFREGQVFSAALLAKENGPYSPNLDKIYNPPLLAQSGSSTSNESVAP